MADILPTAFFAGYASDGNNITIPLTDLPALTAAEANPATGDGREVVRSILEKIASIYLALETADRPTKMVVAKPNPVGIGTNQVSQTYTFTFQTRINPNNAILISE